MNNETRGLVNKAVTFSGKNDAEIKIWVRRNIHWFICTLTGINTFLGWSIFP